MSRNLAGALAATLLTIMLAHSAFAQLNPFGRSGFELTPGDVELLEAAAEKLYLGESTEIGAMESWSNPESGNSGTVQLVQFGEYKGLPCRRLQHDITLRRVADPFRYIIDRCKTESGEWKIL